MGSTRRSQARMAVLNSRYRFSHFQDEPVLPDLAFVLSPVKTGRGFFLRFNPRPFPAFFQQDRAKPAGGF